MAGYGVTGCGAYGTAGILVSSYGHAAGMIGGWGNAEGGETVLSDTCVFAGGKLSHRMMWVNIGRWIINKS